MHGKKRPTCSFLASTSSRLLCVAAGIVIFVLSGQLIGVQEKRQSLTSQQTRGVPKLPPHDPLRPASVLLLTVWMLPDASVLSSTPSAADCASAFAGAGVLLNTVSGAGTTGVTVLMVHNTPCPAASIAPSIPSLLAVSVTSSSTYHVFDDRWVWYSRILRAWLVADASGAAWGAVLAANGTRLDGVTAIAKPAPAFSHVLVMDASDARLLTSPVPFFNAHPDSDVFIGEECTPNGGNTWMLERYEACTVDTSEYIAEQILNAGVIGARIGAMSWLADGVVRELELAVQRGGKTCADMGIDMILVNHVLRTRATLDGVRLSAGEPFVATYHRTPYYVTASFHGAAAVDALRGGARLGVGPPDDAALTLPWPSFTSCGCVYGPRGQYHESRSSWDSEAEVKCSKCVPFLAIHKTRVRFAA